MKESVLDVLMYLFEHYLEDDNEFESNQDVLHQELAAAGFPQVEIDKAFAWLDGLAISEIPIARRNSMGPLPTRVYTDEEAERLGLPCRSFLLFLEHVGILDMTTRERIIDRVMALESEEVELDQFKWVVLMVLFNQPGNESMYSWMEDFVFDGSGNCLH